MPVGDPMRETTQLLGRRGGGIIQWLLLSCLVILAGTLIFFALQLPIKYVVIVLFAILAPVAALMTGRWKSFFLAVMVLGIPLQVKKTVFGYSMAHIGGPGGIDVTMADGALIALYLHWFYQSATCRLEKKTHFDKLDFLLLGLLFISGLSLLRSVDLPLSVIEYVRTLKVAAIYFYLANNVRKNSEIRLILLMLLIGVTIHCGVSLGQYLLQRPLGLAFLGEIAEFDMGESGPLAQVRPSGVMQGANTSAVYLISVMPFAFMGLWWMRSTIGRVFCLGVFGTMFVVLAISLSRGGWVGFACSFSLLLYLLINKKLITYRRHFLGFLMTGCGLALVVAALWSRLIDRLLHTSPIPIYTREFLNQVAYKLIGLHPVIGVGLNNFEEAARTVMRSVSDPHNIFYLVSDNPIVHNLYLLLCAETGPIGLIVFLTIVYVLMKKARHMIKCADPFVASQGIAVLCFLSGFLVAELFDFSYRLDAVFYLFWTLAGLTQAVWRIHFIHNE